MLDPRPEAQAIAADPEGERQPLLSPQDGIPKDNSAEHDSPPAEEKILLRVSAAMLSFLVLGIHTAALGVLIPSMESYWHISDSQISLIFLTPLAGYLVASLSNSTIHAKFGRRGIAFIGSTCQLLVGIVAAFHLPYPVFLAAFAVARFGIGLIDAGWCAWAGGLRNANTVSGFLHGSYSAGATIGPYLTASLISGLGWQWWSFYWVMVCASGFPMKDQRKD
jgi:fucose permease